MNWNKLLKENKILNGIKGFEGKYECFSNFYIHDTLFVKLPYGKKDAKVYRSDNVETLFQASKCTNHKDIQSIVYTATPGQAKRIGRRVKLREDWEEIKEDVMYELVKQKLNVVPEFKKLLSEIPYNTIIAEFNNWNDKEWGVCSKTLVGNNKLGEILMKLRVLVKEERYYESLKFIFRSEVDKIIHDYKDKVMGIKDKLTDSTVNKLFDFYFYDTDPLEFNILDNNELIKFIKLYIVEVYGA